MNDAPDEGRWSDTQRRHEHALIDELSRLGADDPRRVHVRDELITMHLPLVRHLARRYRDRGESLDDLVQIGTVGLIKAIDGYDPTRGAELSTYATPTILGEIKRHFRDRAWAVRVPRRLQELSRSVATTSDELTVTLQRSPTVREIAEALDVSTADVLEALEARAAYVTDSIDSDDDEGAAGSAAFALGADDPAFAAIDDLETLRPLLESLSDRERALIKMRFFDNMSQSQIAAELGLSQMHISRLLARTLATLRSGMNTDES